MKTADIMPFSPSERVDLEANFGRDAEYYEQAGQTFAIAFTTDESGPTMCESFPIGRNADGKLTSSGTPTNEFDWESAEAFRGEPFPS